MENPIPKFKKGQIVKYNSNKRREILNNLEDLKKKYPGENFGNQPIHNLRIFIEPRWSKTHNCYVYDYEYGYGYTSEGSALEIDLELSSNNGFKIF